MSAPIGSGGQYYPGSPEDQATRQKAESQSAGGVASLVGGAIGKATLGALGIKAGLIDQILNTLFYSFCAVAGISAMVIGLNLIVKEVPGASGVGSVLGGIGGGAVGVGGSAARGVGSVGGRAVNLGKGLGGRLASVAAPETAIPAKVISKATAPKKSVGPGPREVAARSAGHGAAQILRARREDSA